MSDHESGATSRPGPSAGAPGEAPPGAEGGVARGKGSARSDGAPPASALPSSALPSSALPASNRDGDANGDAPASDRDGDAPASGEPASGAGEATHADGAALDANGAKPAKDGVDAKDAKPAKDDDAAALLTKGNPLRRLRGGATAAVGALGAFLVMAHDAQLRNGVAMGTVFVAIAAFGVMDLLGTFDDPADRVDGTTTLSALGWPIGQAAASGLLFALSLMGAASGFGPQALWGAVVTLVFLGFVASVYQLGVAIGPWAKDELGLARPIWRRHGFWVVAAGALLYLPAMGSYSLWDPWETHYGEVAREILSRDDWISLWWAQDGWFWSKPILNFWIQAIAMASLGTHYQPDAMLIGYGGGPSAHPEWVVRAPVVLMTLLAMYLLYKGVARIFGRRAGLLGGLVLATMPDWFFLAHQTMTDMPFVAAMTAAMGLLLLGLHTDEGQLARVYEVKTGSKIWRLSGWHLVFGAILMCVIPQVLYLLSRNIELVVHGGPKGFRPHFDEFKSGSGMGNCGGLPGNEACAVTSPASIPRGMAAHPTGGVGSFLSRYFVAVEPSLQALFWAVVAGSLLYMNWGERRLRRLYYLAAWFFAAIATMAKGPAGFALPMICAFAYVCTKKKWSELARLELVSGILVILAVALPWYVAMYVRHGSPFTDRLIFHDMFNRAFHHVHDTNEGDDTSFRFYIWQLGYAMFPWTGLAPLGLVYWLRRGDSADRGRGDVSVFLAMWFIFAFALFSFMGTKFHHYIFPAVPPVAMLIGIVLDDMLGRARVATTAAGAPLSSGYREPAPPLDSGDDARRAHEQLMIGGAALAGAFVIALVGRDLIIKPEGADQPGAIRLLHLFTYNYRRPWPETLDFSTSLTVFTVVGAALLALMILRTLRPRLTVAFTAFALAWAVWGLDVYMVKTAPHWGQHEVIEAYYANRAGAQEPLVAYQMNWKGENFYTGNKVPAFVSSGATFTNWIHQQKEKGTKVVFFVTEHSRTGGLRSEVGAKSYREVTDKALCNKFVLVRAEL